MLLIDRTRQPTSWTESHEQASKLTSYSVKPVCSFRLVSTSSCFNLNPDTDTSDCEPGYHHIYRMLVFRHRQFLGNETSPVMLSVPRLSCCASTRGRDCKMRNQGITSHCRMTHYVDERWLYNVDWYCAVCDPHLIDTCLDEKDS